MGRPLPGPALEDSAEDLKGIANYEGKPALWAQLPVSSVLVSSELTWLSSLTYKRVIKY